MVILKNFFILLLSINLYSNNLLLKEANQALAYGNYLKASSLYEKIYKTYPTPSIKSKLIRCYTKLGDNFFRVDNYKKALYFYKKASKLKAVNINIKIAKIYAKQGKLYYKIKNYKKALYFYKKALKLGYKKAKKDIKIIQHFVKHENALKNDRRKLITNNSPKWTKAIGRVIIPTKLTFVTKKRYRTKYKKCSASLVNLENYSSSSVIITASHCLKGYNSNAGGLKFIIKSKQGNMLQRFAAIYKDSHYIHKQTNKHSDYAILILDSPIYKKDVDPLSITKTPFYNLQKQYKYSFASLVGFSGDIGDHGEKLTIDPKCKLFKFNTKYGKSNCIAYKGASGGPIVLNLSNNGKNFQQYLVGIVSHFKRKDFKHIYFAPNTQFYKDLVEAIKLYNF